MAATAAPGAGASRVVLFSFQWEVYGNGERGGRSRRMFDGSELRLVLLKLIEEQPRHGYDLIRDIEERTGGAYAPSPGVIYPTLTMLDDMGMIEEQKSEGAKKLYRDHQCRQGPCSPSARKRSRRCSPGSTTMGTMPRARPAAAPVRRAHGQPPPGGASAEAR